MFLSGELGTAPNSSKRIEGRIKNETQQHFAKSGLVNPSNLIEPLHSVS
jgi:hypothetical protein